MIHDSCKNLNRYLGIHPLLDSAIRFILAGKFENIGECVQLDGEQLYIKKQRPAFLSAQDQRWENHRKYMDIQLALEDGESIACLPNVESLVFETYSDETDCEFAQNNITGNLIEIKKGECVILWPGEPHKPLLGEGVGHKLVFKIKIAD